MLRRNNRAGRLKHSKSDGRRGTGRVTEREGGEGGERERGGREREMGERGDGGGGGGERERELELKNFVLQGL